MNNNLFKMNNNFEIKVVNYNNYPIFIIDNFFENHHKILEWSKNINFKSEKEEGNYPGSRYSLRSNLPFATESIDIINQFYSRLNKNVKIFQNPLKSVISITNIFTPNLTSNQINPHIDGYYTYAGIIYLNNEVNGGTGFYQSKLYNKNFAFRDWVTTNSKYNRTPCNEQKWPVYENDYWKLNKILKMKSNRGIFFWGNMFHSNFLNENFWKNKKIPRTTINMFYKIKTNDNIENDLKIN